MNRPLMIALTLAAAFAWLAPPAAAEDEATPQEVIAKVKEAAAYLAEQGESGLKTFDEADSRFVWKDTYVFVYDCEHGFANVAHPVPATKKVKLTEDTDADGKVIGPEFCKAAARPGGGWLEYPWWKAIKVGDDELTYAKDMSRKVSYMLQVEGQPYQVGAGVYNDTLSVEDLNGMVEE